MFGREFQAGEHRQHVVPSPPTGYGFEKAGYESLRTADSYQFGGGWSAKIVYENDDEGEYAEAILTGPGGVEEIIYPGDGRTFEPGELEDEARQLISEYGDSPYEDTYQYNSSRTAAVQWEEDSLLSPSPDGGKTRYWTAFPDGASEDDLTSFANVSEITPNLFRWVVLGPYGETIAKGEETSLDAAKAAAEGPLMSGREFQAGSRKEASRQETASHHLAFFDGFDIPEPRHRVAGWDWDDHLNGFLAAEAAREFTCSCGANVPAPGYTDCRCGKRWNAYTIQANGSKKMIAREVPVRDGVVMAGRTASRVAAYEEDDGYTSPEAGDSIEVHSGGSYFEVLYDKRIGDHKFRATNGQEFYVTSIVSINENRVDPDKIRLEASRKQADNFGEDWLYVDFLDWARRVKNQAPTRELLYEYLDSGEVNVDKSGGAFEYAISRLSSRKQAGELWIEDGDTSFFQYDSHAGEFYAEVYPASGSYTWFLSDPSGVRTYADGYGVATVEEAKAQAEQALTKVIGSEPVVAGRKQGKESWDEWAERMKRQDAEGTGYGSVPGWHLDLPDESPGDEDIDNPDYENPGRF